LFKNVLILILQKKKKRSTALILDFDKKSTMDVTLMPPSAGALPKESIQILVSDDKKPINAKYVLHFSEHLGVASAKVHDSWKKKLESLVLKSQKKKDVYREHKDKKKKKKEHETEEKGDKSPRQHSAMIEEYKRIFETDRTVDEKTLSIMDKYCPSESTKKRLAEKKKKDANSMSSLRLTGDKETEKKVEDNLLKKFVKSVITNDDADTKKNSENKASVRTQPVDDTKPKGYVSPYADTDGLKVHDEKPKGYVSPYDDEKPALVHKSSEKLLTEKPKGYISPYDNTPKSGETATKSGEQVRKLFGGLLNLGVTKEKKEDKNE
jgi:hypothetical protein